jgi:hypothetical protein
MKIILHINAAYIVYEKKNSKITEIFNYQQVKILPGIAGIKKLPERLGIAKRRFSNRL